MKVRTNKINLLPKEYIQAEKMRLRLMIIGGVLALEVAIFITFVAMPPKVEIQETLNRLDEVALEINDSRFTDVNQIIQQLEDAKVEMDQWAQKYSNLKQENFVSKRVLDSLLTRVPMNVTLDKLLIIPEDIEISQLEKTIFIEGTSQDIVSVLNYVTVIEGVYGSGTTNYEAEYNEERGVYEYTINVVIPVGQLEVEENLEGINPEEVTGYTTEANDGGDN